MDKTRCVKITRVKCFAGARIPYMIHIGYPVSEEICQLVPDAAWEAPVRNGIRIENGKTVSIDIGTGPCSLVVSAMTASGMAGGPAYHIDAGVEDITLELVTRYSWIRGSSYHLRPAK